jgi:hypothetical protein
MRRGHPRSRAPLPRLLPALLLALPLAGALAGRAGADLLLSVKGHVDGFSVGNRTQEAKDSDVKIWLATDRMRRDEGPLTAIVRLDRQKLYLVNHTDRTYSTVDLPVDWTKLIPKVDQEKFQQYVAENQIRAAITPSSETRKVRAWDTHRVDVELSNRQGLRVSTRMWVSRDIGLYAAYNKMSGSLASLQVNGADWSQKIDKLDGFPVYQETVVSVGGMSFKSVEQLMAADPKEPPPGTYDVPAGFRAVPYDPLGAPQ